MLFRKHAKLSTSVLRSGEALVTIGSSPAIPAELAPAPTWFLRSVDTVAESDQQDELQPWLRRSVAQWLGVYLEAASSDDPDNRIRFEWNGDTLFIHRTTWDYSYTAPIEAVRPNGRGLYLITSLDWSKLSQAELIGLTKHDRRALKTLASDAGPHVAPEMMTYFKDDEVIDIFSITVESVIRSRSTTTAFDMPVPVSSNWPNPEVASNWKIGWRTRDGRQPIAAVRTRHIPGAGYVSTVYAVLTTGTESDMHTLPTGDGEQVILDTQISVAADGLGLRFAHITAVTYLRMRYATGDPVVTGFFDSESARFAS